MRVVTVGIADCVTVRNINDMNTIEYCQLKFNFKVPKSIITVAQRSEKILRKIFFVKYCDSIVLL